MLHVKHDGNSRLQWDKVKDSLKKEAFGSGSMRDSQNMKGRYDLIPSVVLKRLAQHYENGAAKYTERNWEKGQPLHQYYNSAIRHLEAIKDADISEDHFAAVIWNIAAMIHHIDKMYDGKLPMELDSFGIINAIKEHQTFEQIKEYYQEATTTYPTIWTPVMVSGAPVDIPLPKVYDKDRFKERHSMTTAKLTEE